MGGAPSFVIANQPTGWRAALSSRKKHILKNIEDYYRNI
jgi:hypothetical protein